MRTTSLTIQAAALLCLGLTVRGLYGMTWSDEVTPLIFVMVAGVMIWGGRQLTRKAPAFICVVLAGLLALASGALWQLFVMLWFGLACLILGRWLLNRLSSIATPWPAQFLVGAGAYGTLVGLIAHLPVAYPGVYGGLLALPLLIFRRSIVDRLRQALQSSVQRSTSNEDAAGQVVWLECALGGLVLLYLAVALMPELGNDALATHLFIPAQLASRHQWGFDSSTYAWAVMPMLGDWIFAIPYMLGGESASRLTNVGFIFLLTWLVRDIALWAGGSARGAKWAALIFLSTPLTFTEGSSLFIESIWASFVVAGTLAVLKACSRPEPSGHHLLTGGVLIGFGVAAKAVTLPMLPVLVLILMWRFRIWCRLDSARLLLWGLTLFFLLGIIPYGTAWWLTGNPVFPFYNAVFKSPMWPPENFVASAFGKGIPFDFLYSISFDSARYLEARAGAGGFQWLLLFLPMGLGLVLTRHWRATGLMVFAALSTVLIFHSTAYLRYIFPAYATLAGVLGLGFTVATSWGPRLSVALHAAGWLTVLLNLHFLNAGAFYADFPFKSIFSESQRDRYLAERLPIRQAVRLVNSLNVSDDPVAVFAEPLGAGLRADALYASWYNPKWLDAYVGAKTVDALARLLMDKRVSLIVVDERWDLSGNLTGSQLELLNTVSEEVWRLGPIAVRRLKDDYRFMSELLKDSDFSDIRNWSLTKGAVHDTALNTVTVSVTSPAAQTVAVVAGRRYQNTVRARCHLETTQGRVQINWNDSERRFIEPTIKVFDCAPDWKEYGMVVTAPPGAANATVYAAGHTSTPMEFKWVSLKQ